MASSSQRRFVDWEERFVSHERGCRVVHYLLRDRVGTQWLAVVGTERSLRHMVYVVCDEFLPVAGLDKSTTSGYKWRARREVVDWLSSFLIKSRASDANHSGGSSRNAFNSSTDVDSSYSHDADGMESGQEESRRRHHHEVDARRQISNACSNSDVVWVAPEWTCRKKLKHFHAFQRNGIVISVRRFVYVMTEEKDRHIAYVEDLYEDKKQRKKLRVRWFHKPNELGCKIPPPAPDRREVFYTSYEQDLSVECVDGLATVLTPEHFVQCSEQLGHAAMADTHMCSRQFDSEGIRPFSIQNLNGYSLQPILSLAGLQPQAPLPMHDHGSEDMELDEDGGVDAGRAVRRGPRTGPRGSRRRPGVVNKSARYQGGKGPSVSQWSSPQRSGDVTAHRSADATASGSGYGDWKGPSSSGVNSEDRSSDQRRSTSYWIGDHIEVLSEDSGIRGCWFKGTVVAVAHRRLKVRYDDLLNDSNTENLEEWISSTRRAAADHERTRSLSLTRPTTRPARGPPSRPIKLHLQKGSFVDAWRGDGWWEGVVNEVNDEVVEVLFPGERDCSSFKIEDLRPAQEWLGNGLWVQLTDWTEITPELEARAEESRKFMPYIIRDSTVCNDASRRGTTRKASNGIFSDRTRNDKIGLKAGHLTSNETSRDDSQVNGSSDSASFDEDEGARILSMLSKSGSVHSCCIPAARPWPIICDVKHTTADDAVCSEGTSTGPVVGSEVRNGERDGRNGGGVAVKVRSSKLSKAVGSNILDLDESYRAHSVKEELHDVGSFRTSSPESSRKLGSSNTNGHGMTTGLKWKRKRHRQGDVLTKGPATLSVSNESKEQSLVKNTADRSADGTCEDSIFQENMENFRGVGKSRGTEDAPKLKRHRQGDSSLKSIHGTSMGGSFLISSMPIANLVMSM